MTALDYLEDLDRSVFDGHNEQGYAKKAQKGLSEALIRRIAKDKNEPAWMLEHRLNSLKKWYELKLPTFGVELSHIDFDDIIYYAAPNDMKGYATKWEDVPDDIKKTFERLGIPEAERKVLAGTGAQYDSVNAYHKLKEEWESVGVIFEDMDVALQKYPDLVKQYFMKLVPSHDHKFAALHGAVWSGGTFLYIPKGVKVTAPLQAYFRMNAKSMGQFEHTLIIIEEGAEGHYIEGCFVAGTPVLVDNTYKNVEAIQPGEKVLTHLGHYRKVKHTQVRPYSGELHKIQILGDSVNPIECTSEHPFWAVKRKYKNDKNKEFNAAWLPASELRTKDYVAFPINQEVEEGDAMAFLIERGSKNKPSLSLRTVSKEPDFFRLIGYFLAEGSTINDFYTIFTFHEKERTYIEDVKKLVKCYFDLDAKESPHVKNHGVSVVVNSADMARIFSANFGFYAGNKSLPRWVSLAALSCQKELICGYFRGDGNYYRSQRASGLKEVFRINSVSKSLAYQIRDVLLRLGVFAFINKRNRTAEGRQDMYTIGISGEAMVPFSKIVGRSIEPLPYGKKRASSHFFKGGYVFVPIRKIEMRSVKKIPVYNFSVEEDESYTVNGVAVHNCSAPKYGSTSLHAGCVEIFVKAGAKFRYSSVENWSQDTYNLNTKRAVVDEDATMEWVGGNLGSGRTMLYPCSILRGRGSHADHLGVAFANAGQVQDTGAKVIHIAPDTSSTVLTKSISKGGGRNVYRGLLQVNKGATGAKSQIRCDSLILDDKSVSDTYPTMRINEDDVSIGHEASTGKISEEQLFYLQSRGLSEDEALAMIVNGFIDPIVKELPLEYAVEMNRLIEMEMEKAIG